MFFDDRQADAQAAVLRVAQCSAGKILEDRIGIFLVDADPRIGHIHLKVLLMGGITQSYTPF